jgi:EAL domain-containing protein (putative c-di-GMP-specific phosphodiesterase class I)/GGDEF domain-containing protein
MGLSTTSDIFFTLLAIIITLALAFGVYVLFKRERKKNIEEATMQNDNFLTKTDFSKNVDYYISRIGQFGSFGMFYFEVENVKGLLETLGRDEFENLLSEISKRLIKDSETNFVITKTSGEGFMLMSKNEYNYDTLEKEADDLMYLLTEPYKIFRDEEIKLAFSMGAVMYPLCGHSYKELSQNLELATYISRRNGENKYTIYYNELREKESDNLEYFKEVKNAIRNREFVLYFQPIVNIKANDIFGFEALLRWNHPLHGVLSPHKFISILEQSGDINWVGLWGLEELIKESIKLNNEFNDRDVYLTFNLSVKQLLNDNVANEFRNLLKRYNKCNPNLIILEVQEFTKYENVEQIKTNLRRFKDLGFKISVDGLALDYASLSSLENSPIDIFKLDRDFLEDIENNFIKEKFVAMLVEYASKEEKIVIAEGVESKEMVDYVIKNNVDYAQGYYFEKPFEESSINDYIYDKKWNK